MTGTWGDPASPTWAQLADWAGCEAADRTLIAIVALRKLCPDPDVAAVRAPAIDRVKVINGIATCTDCGLPEAVHAP